MIYRASRQLPQMPNHLHCLHKHVFFGTNIQKCLITTKFVHKILYICSLIPYNVIVENMNGDTTILERERKEKMKKQYVAPIADKVDFDYEENVTASGPSTPTNKGYCDGCKQYNPPAYNYSAFIPIPFVTPCFKWW